MMVVISALIQWSDDDDDDDDDDGGGGGGGGGAMLTHSDLLQWCPSCGGLCCHAGCSDEIRRRPRED